MMGETILQASNTKLYEQLERIRKPFQKKKKIRKQRITLFHVLVLSLSGMEHKAWFSQ